MEIHLKASRVNAGFTQSQVSEQIRISKSTIRNYEKYKSIPDIETAKKLAALYGMSVDNIIWSANQ